MAIARRSLFLVTALCFASVLMAAPGEVTVSIVDIGDSVVAPGNKDVSSPHSDVRAKIVPDSGDPGYSQYVAVDTTYPGNTVSVILESGNDLQGWSDTIPGTFDVSGGKQFFRVRAETVFNEFVLVDASGQAFGDFYIGRYEVTKEEWDQTYAWALQNGYDFTNMGDGCNDNHPVTNLTWYDIVKWCNARSEREGLTPVYYTDATHTVIYKTGELDLLEEAFVDSNDGYRLPYIEEWLFAASGGGIAPEYTYSGSDTVGDVAIYSGNSAPSECGGAEAGTWPVGSLAANELGLYDMSGNVFEALQDANSANRGIKGGSYRSGATQDPLPPDFLQVVDGVLKEAEDSAAVADVDIGFRLIRTAPAPAAAQQSLAIEDAPTFLRKKPKKDKGTGLLK